MKYKNLVFDLYGTLVDIHTETPDSVWEKTALYFGFYGAAYTPCELQKEFDRLTASLNAAAGDAHECFPEVPIEQVFSKLFQQKGITAATADSLAPHAAQLFRIESIDYIRLYPGVMEALAALRADGHRLWLLSNAQQIFTAYELRLLGLHDQFEKIYLSSDYNCRKPDSRFFELLHTDAGLTLSECLMIGNDLSTDIAGAKTAGMDAFYIHSNISPALTPEQLAAIPSVLSPDYQTKDADWTRLLPMLRRICRD